ncbi:regulatory protein RecX [Bifidobacterium bombi]|uniref:Regulatory protein RecX n=1 Tax=Bifidobacterium bombi DSM 19703 TaxID=1341695 RepID=A0A080N2V4_9BIFI|nr:regulatory protein RecX [Bifidobacterium bombi]KFF31388.1 RecX transcriptional regulator [Bifidobacterium bombi DSM 19703]
MIDAESFLQKRGIRKKVCSQGRDADGDSCATTVSGRFVESKSCGGSADRADSRCWSRVTGSAHSDPEGGFPQTSAEAGETCRASSDSLRSDRASCIDDAVEVSFGGGRGCGGRSGRLRNLAPTHAVPVTSAFTSGFGASPHDEVTDSQDDSGSWRKPARHRSGGGRRSRGSYRKRGYRSGAPMVRVPDDPDDYESCREAALSLLDSAARSSGGIRKRLISKGYGEEVSSEVVDRLVQLHLIDDEAYAQSVVRSCLARQFGSRGVFQELRRKDVDSDLASAQVRLAEEQGAFEDAAWELGCKVAAKTQGLDMEVRRRRFWGAGGRKGHDSETLSRVAQELFVK